LPPFPDSDATPDTVRPHADDRPALAAWHAGWAAAAALTALAGRWLEGVDAPLFAGLLVLTLPGLSGLGLLARAAPADRLALQGVWSLAAVICAGLSGGLLGPLAGFVFLPLAAGVALGGSGQVRAGAAGSVAAMLSGLFSAWLVGDPGAANPSLAAISILLVAAATALAVHLSWRRRERDVAANRDAVGRVETLLAGQPGLTLVLEPDGRALAAYGSPPPALPMEPLFDPGLAAAVHAPDRPALLAALDRARSGREAAAVVAPRHALDRRIQFLFRRLGEDDSRLVGQAFDATGQYARELGLEVARAEAEAREAGKTRFLATMSHELRTPLNAVLGFSDIMRQRLFGPIPDRYAEYADTIHQAGGHLLDLINDLLDVSKIEAERYTLARERFDVREVISAAMALMRVGAEEKGVTLSGVLPSDPLEVSADRRALKQIALNLLSNAVKFTPAGGSVTVAVEALGPQLEIVVADTGVGIAPEDVKRLGRPFEQAGAPEQRRLGTGLGLSLVRAFAELHDGRMTIESTLGEGTAVTVRMPVALSARAPAPEGGAEIIPLPVANGG